MISGIFLEKASEVVVKTATKKIKNLIAGFNFANHTEVVVGIPEDSNVTRENGITNSQLLYIHEHGVPSHNIPPRPVLIPAIAQEEAREKIMDEMKTGLKSALVWGNVQEAEKCYHKAGMLGRDACKDYIVSGDKLAPNAPSTIARKLAKTPKGRPKNPEDVKPLIDTASMLNSITYAVRKKR